MKRVGFPSCLQGIAFGLELDFTVGMPRPTPPDRFLHLALREGRCYKRWQGFDAVSRLSEAVHVAFPPS